MVGNEQKREKGHRGYRLPVTGWVSLGDEKYSIGNIVSGIVNRVVWRQMAATQGMSTANV